jgi:hypothetical protein
MHSFRAVFIAVLIAAAMIVAALIVNGRRPRVETQAPWRAVAVFIIANLGFLGLDVWIAHSVNRFERAPEWFPFYFSLRRRSFSSRLR